tara:strand:+ start:123122 stop:123760 length:639 start_codon:yes stop_codon:yes gene_type:complete
MNSSETPGRYEAEPPLVIVTGFGPFPGVTDNPSEMLLRELERAQMSDGLRHEFVLLETAYRHVSDRVAELLARRPAVVIHLGYISTAAMLCLECRATSKRSTSHPDVTGFTPYTKTPPTVLENRRVNFTELLTELAAAGIPAQLSHDAGTYVCNHTYFTVLNAIRHAGLQTKALFVHIPMVSELEAPRAGVMGLATMAEGVRLIARRMAGVG